MMISFRLDSKTAQRLESAAKARGMSKSELVRTCLDEFLADHQCKPTAWELGQQLFGCFESGQGDRSRRTRQKSRERIRSRRSR